MLATCQPGAEHRLARELAGLGLAPCAEGSGWVHGRGAGAGEPPETAFAHLILADPREFQTASVNALAQQIVGFFAESIRAERIEAVWPCVWGGAAGVAGLSRRVRAVERSAGELLRRKLSRVGGLASSEAPRPGPARGLFVYFTAFDRAWAARAARCGGQRRMADDPAAPSRSYLKIEEAYGVAGREPRAGETVADLGAAPGGWSYSAAKRGARVTAVDRGPLKGGARGHPRIAHRREDAFGFRPAAGQRFDWLFCDLLEEPHHVLRDLVRPWLERGWCRRFIVNLKFGRVDPLALLGELRAPTSPLATRATDVRIRHLYHDREEFTVVGKVGAG
jgi:23S rRNA (cytidine2498-2'-O)-methyltransferase